LTGVFEDFPLRESGSTGGYHHSIANTTTSTALKKNKRALMNSVSFKEVQVRQYERIMTDNPSCTGGPAIGVGWRFVSEKPVSVDEWELCRRKGSRSPSELVLNRARREKLIRGLGYADREIAANVRELNRLRSQRRQTVNNLSAQKVEEAVETAKRQVKRLLFLQRSPKDLTSLPPLVKDVPERVEL